MSDIPKAAPGFSTPAGGLLAARCHDVTISLNGRQVADFDQLLIGGMAARLALHLRGVGTVPYNLLRAVAVHLLNVPSTSVPLVLETLAEAEFVKLDKQGHTIRSIVPTVPYYEELFKSVGEVLQSRSLSEPEAFTLAAVNRLSGSPVIRSTLYEVGAEKKLVDKVIDLGVKGGYIVSRRSRGRDILVSPMYFAENADQIADLTVAHGSGRLARVLSLVAANPGLPLAVIQKTKRIGETSINDEDVNLLLAISDGSFTFVPSISTSHAGTNYFVFGPTPGMPRLSATKRAIFEKAMALLAAVRQGQFLAAAYRIKWPNLLLQKLKRQGWLKANSEAYEQYHQVAVRGIGRLIPEGSGKFRFEIIRTEENLEAVQMAIDLLSQGELSPAVDEEAVLAFRKGQQYVESLVARQELVKMEKVELDPDSQREIDDFLLQGIT